MWSPFVTLWSMLPPIVHTVLLVLFQIGLCLWALATGIVWVSRRTIAAPRFVYMEQTYPRFGHSMRALRKFATDIDPFVREVWLIVRGTPFPVPSIMLTESIEVTRTTTVSTDKPQRGSAIMRDMLAVVGTVILLAVLARVLPGCPSRGEPDCTTPGAFQCDRRPLPQGTGRARRCSTEGYWTPIGDRPCALLTPPRECRENIESYGRLVAGCQQIAADGGVR